MVGIGVRIILNAYEGRSSRGWPCALEIVRESGNAGFGGAEMSCLFQPLFWRSAIQPMLNVLVPRQTYEIRISK